MPFGLSHPLQQKNSNQFQFALVSVNLGGAKMTPFGKGNAAVDLTYLELFDAAVEVGDSYLQFK